MRRSFDTIVNRFCNLLPYFLRKKIFVNYGIEIGDNAVIRKDVFFETDRVKIGKNTFINTFVDFIPVQVIVAYQSVIMSN